MYHSQLNINKPDVLRRSGALDPLSSPRPFIFRALQAVCGSGALYGKETHLTP